MLFGTHAKVFIAVVEQGNIQEAASVLKISQSSVSYHLKELEKEVGFQLYDRSQKPNHLTEEGALGSSAKYVIFPNRPSEALFPKNLTGIFHRGGIDQSLINQFPPS